MTIDQIRQRVVEIRALVSIPDHEAALAAEHKLMVEFIRTAAGLYGVGDYRFLRLQAELILTLRDTDIQRWTS